MGAKGAEPYLTDCPGHDGLQNWPAVIMEQMYLVDDEKTDELGVSALPRLPGDDIPLLWGGDYDLCGIDLRLGQVDVTRQLLRDDAIGFEALAEVPNHLGNESLQPVRKRITEMSRQGGEKGVQRRHL